MSPSSRTRPIELLLVEDNPADVRLTQEAFADCKLRNNLHVVNDGRQALDFLRQNGAQAEAPRPDMVLLDLNLPGMSGIEVLRAIKSDEHFKNIPVVVLTTSSDEKDIVSSYQLHANCFITKPLDFIKFVEVVKSIENFWFTVVRLPD